jgi:hypothetical protein
MDATMMVTFAFRSIYFTFGLFVGFVFAFIVWFFCCLQRFVYMFLFCLDFGFRVKVR